MAGLIISYDMLVNCVYGKTDERMVLRCLIRKMKRFVGTRMNRLSRNSKKTDHEVHHEINQRKREIIDFMKTLDKL
jgi:type IV secretory pathway VirD2 relaxase